MTQSIHSGYGLELTSPYGVITRVRVATDGDRGDLSEFNRLATITLSTGACGLQTYGTAAQCRAVAKALLDAAAEIDAMNEVAA